MNELILSALKFESQFLQKRCFVTSSVCFHLTNVRAKIFQKWDKQRRRVNTPEFPDDYTNKSKEKRKVPFKESVLPEHFASFRFKYPEFLPVNDPTKRHKVATLLEREDMLSRRANVDIPEFYVGSIIAVTVSDPYAPGKISRFLGICIKKTDQGLRHYFTLRNHIDGEGIEIRYEMYNPTIRHIEVIKLEKRLDDEMLYLRDAPAEYSTFPQDMTPVIHQEGEPVPVNPLKVKLKPWPWTKRWDVVFPKIYGVESLDQVPDCLYYRSRKSHNKFEKFDLVQQYRDHITEEDQLEVWGHVHDRIVKLNEMRRDERRKKFLQTAK
ncbi:39S ribosomal protein L19-like protein [Leptotrombidium deliense]|uniref:Large ribosomal subunit protein bL19m n=1 Tax=Leptotrombidium deliense TaxID=299467 RepID=A0A443SVB9_9ACAR|nr:39S ribosomal protein L19-like protein [Leptotrombidium deliense]